MPERSTGHRGARRRPIAILILAAVWAAATASSTPAQQAATEIERMRDGSHGDAPPAQAGQTTDSVDLVVHVRDDAGEPVRGASVWVRSGESWIEGQSNPKGVADFEDLAPGAARVQVVATGWNSSGSSVDLDGPEVTVDVALDRRPAPQSADADPEGPAPDSSRHARAARHDAGAAPDDRPAAD